jgi:putative effector of murein hydrolase
MLLKEMLWEVDVAVYKVKIRQRYRRAYKRESKTRNSLNTYSSFCFTHYLGGIYSWLSLCTCSQLLQQSRKVPLSVGQQSPTSPLQFLCAEQEDGPFDVASFVVVVVEIVVSSLFFGIVDVVLLLLLGLCCGGATGVLMGATTGLFQRLGVSTGDG